MSRLTAAGVRVVVNNADTDGGRHIAAMVQGRNRIYYVDHDTHWGPNWYCTCPPKHRPKDGTDCPHVRATKEATAQ